MQAARIFAVFSHLECATFQPFHRLPQPGNGFGFKNDSTAILTGEVKIFLQVDFPRAKRQMVFSACRIMKVEMMQFIPVVQKRGFIYMACSVIMANIEG